MEKQQVIIPIVLPLLRDRNVKCSAFNTTKAIEWSFASGKPCALAAWGFSPQHEDIPSPPRDHQRAPLRGAFIGCEDGSVYLFHPKLGTKADLISPARFNFDLVDTLPLSRVSTPSVTSRLGRNISASSSRSSLKLATNPLHLSRSRIVSGVTTEAVEAPKNYVDFEEEQEKLKDLLKTKSSVKERHLTDGVSSPVEKKISVDKHIIQPLTTISPQPQNPTRKKSESRIPSSTHSRTPSHPMNLTSTQNSPATTPLQLYITGDIYSLYLRSHTFPSHFGPGRAISQLVVDESQRYVVCLQENGYISQRCIPDTVLTIRPRDISVLSAIDGSCHGSARSDSPILMPPSGTVDHHTLHCAWKWKYLHLVKTQTVSTASILQSNSLP